MSGSRFPSYPGSGLPYHLIQQLQRRFPWADRNEIARLFGLTWDQGADKAESATDPSQGQDQNQDQGGPGTRLPSLPAESFHYPPPLDLYKFPCLTKIIVKAKDPAGPPENTVPVIQAQALDIKKDCVLGNEIATELLMPWERIWPRIRQLCSHRFRTRKLDVPKIIDRAIRVKPLERIPWHSRKAWPVNIVLVLDFSRHLSPYFQDYRFLARQMRLWFRERLEIVACTDSARQSYRYNGDDFDQFPLNLENMEIIYAGDMGFLDSQGLSRGVWHGTLGRLKKRNARISALLTVHPQDWDLSFAGLAALLHWDKDLCPAFQGGNPPCFKRHRESRGQVEGLLCALAGALEITPALARKARRFLGFNVSTESLLFQHPALGGNGLSFQWTSARDRLAYKKRAENQRDTLPDIWPVIQAFESRLPVEMQIEQRQWAQKGLAREHNMFLSKLRVFYQEPHADAGTRETLLGWIGRVAQRSGDEPWAPELNDLFAICQQETGLKQIPGGTDLIRVPDSVRSAGPIREMRLGIQNSDLVFAAPNAPDRSRSWQNILTFSADRRSQVVVKGQGRDRKYAFEPGDTIHLPPSTDRVCIETRDKNYVICSESCPEWASGMGYDAFGLFLAVDVAETDFVMRWIPPGSFLMGSDENEKERLRSEGPQHLVTLETGFWMADTACTQALWQAVMKKNPSRFKGRDLPVEKVSFDQTGKFIETLNQMKPGLNICLPSEAWWEYACRAGTETPFWLGGSLSSDQANFDGNYPYAGGRKGKYRETTVPVKRFDPNPWGLYQMHGNVWEWCADRWHDTYEGAPDDGSAWLTGGDKEPVVRGGSWSFPGRFLRSAWRARVRHVFIDDRFGFRLSRGPLIQE